jgi:uncharacterized membrane protein (DUF2068 family)
VKACVIWTSVHWDRWWCICSGFIYLKLNVSIILCRYERVCFHLANVKIFELRFW